VKTNQTDVPLSQLQVRSSISPGLARNSTAVWAREKYVASELPELKSAEGPVNIPSSPPGSATSHDEQVGADDSLQSPMKRPGYPQQDFATPNLPKKRNIGLQPAAVEEFESPDFRRRGSTAQELTSSVIKGRAADGLLSLMGAYR